MGARAIALAGTRPYFSAVAPVVQQAVPATLFSLSERVVVAVVAVELVQVLEQAPVLVLVLAAVVQRARAN